MSRETWRPGPPLLGLFAGWVALFAWSGMVSTPLGFLVPTLLIGLATALLGSALRVFRVPAYVVAAVQVVVAFLSLNVMFASQLSLLRVIPTEASVRQLFYMIGNGAATLNAFSAPVEVNPTHTRAMLMACGLAVLLSIDVLAMGLRRPSLVALPLLVTLSIPVSILRESLALPVYIGTALLFLRLLATERLDRFGSWGRQPDGTARPVLTTLWGVSLVAVLVSLLASPLVPVADLLDRQPGTGSGIGGGGRYQLTAINPFIRLRRDLVEKTHTPLVYARTDAASTSYLRTTVLDQFTSNEWRPSPRNLPPDNSADGRFPSPPGLAAGASGVSDDWTLELAPGFVTTWLPLPYPIRELQVPGNWRYDARTLDVALVGGGTPDSLRYTTTSFTPSVTAAQLEGSVSAPGKIKRPMTDVPEDLPEVITTRAREITEGAATDFDKAVAIQNWFRQDGGFRYSLEQRGGSGMDLLADFVTNDRVGYCEQFAAAMAAMGRVLGIPSRVVVGFLDGTEQQDGRILYTSDERHAWPEMYFAGVGWVRFEPTPGQRSGATPPYTRQDSSQPGAATAPSSQASPNSSARPDQSASDSSSGGGGGISIPAWPLVALLVVLVLGLAPALVRAVQRRRRLSRSDPVHLAEGAWAELRATALDVGLEWPERGSPREQARSVVDQVRPPDDEVRSLEGLLVQVERGRYARDPGGGVATVDPEERARTVETVGTWRRTMVGSVDRERGWRGRVWPRSVVRGPQ